jgi:toxin ParE1/3/4
MAEFQRTSQANHDLQEIWDYIAEDSMESADRIVEEIEEKCALLADFPSMGHNCEELVEKLRSFPVRDYILFYQPLANGIVLVRVIHGARDIDAQFDS